MRPQVGQVINNKYRLLRLIGDGGMGSVYEARHELLSTSVALKFLHQELSRRPGLVQRFLQEAKVSAQIHSPHVVRVSDVDQTVDGHAYIVLEYLQGKTLQTLYEDLYKAGQRLSYTDALEYSMQMLEGVDAAHRAGIVHRDLKPDNVMITTGPKGRIVLKVLDFGIAKLRVSGEVERGLTRPGVIMGTPEYMAPEQAYSADAVDARADVFSLGVMIFEMLAGRRPVGGDEPQQIATAYLSGQVARLGDLMPGVSPELAAAVHRAMAPLARDRWASASDLRDALEPFAFAAKAPSVMPSNPSFPGITPNPPSISGGTTDRNTPFPAIISHGSADVFQDGAASSKAAPDLARDGAASSPQPRLSQEPPRSSVPKTWPPEDGPVAAAPVEIPAAPAPAVFLPEQTPLGGFGQGAVAADAAPAAIIAPTVSAPPYTPSPAPVVDGGSTSFAAPLSALPQRPSGTAPGAGSAVEAAGYGGTAGSAPFTPEYVGYGPAPVDNGGYAGGPSAYAPGPASVASPPTVAKPKRRGSSLGLILLLAAGIAGAVVGGVYLAQQRAKVDDHDDPPVPVPTATVKSDPPPTSTAPPPPVPVPTVVRPAPQPGPRPQPRPSGSQNQPPPPGSNTSIPIIPTALPFVLPSQLPPFLQGPRPQDEPPPPRREPRRDEPRDSPTRSDMYQRRAYEHGPPNRERPHIILRPRRVFEQLHFMPYR